MVKNLLLKSLCFIGLCLQAFPSLSGTEHVAAGLKEAFAGRAPFFAISVSRTTKHNEERDCPPLTATERFFVRSVLEMVLKEGHSSGMFQVKLEASLRQDLEQYRLLENKFTEIKASFVDEEIISGLKQEWLEKFPAEKRDAIWNAMLSGQENLSPINFGMDSFSRQQQSALKIALPKVRNLTMEIDAEKDKRTLKQLTKLEQKFIEYWRDPQHQNMLEQCHAVWEKLLPQIESNARFFSQINLFYSYGLVVFSEMFFGKNTPFPIGVLESEMSMLSFKYPSKIFHANFLVSMNFNPPYYQHFIRHYKGNDRIFSVESNEYWREKSYEDYFLPFAQVEKNPLQILRNISRSYFHGHELTQYLKSTYQQEDDIGLRNGMFYMFGNGYDAKVSVVAEETANVLLDNLATEICYDLELGIRKKMNSYRENLKIFVVPSNTLAFTDERMANLPTPDQSKIIFHVDPTEQAIFAKTPIIAQELSGQFARYAEHTWQKERPIFILQFELKDSLYQIKLWDIRRLLG